MMSQAILNKLRTARPEDMSRDVLDFFELKPGDRLDWNADLLHIGEEEIPIADVLKAEREMNVANGVRTIELPDLQS